MAPHRRAERIAAGLPGRRCVVYDGAGVELAGIAPRPWGDERAMAGKSVDAKTWVLRMASLSVSFGGSLMERHDTFARDLMERYPEETSGFSVEEVRAIWERVSAYFAAGWLDSDQVDGLVVEQFSQARRRRAQGRPI